MKKLFTLALLSISAAVWAAPDSDMGEQSLTDRLCAGSAELAETAQMANQVGYPLTKALAVVPPEAVGAEGSRAIIIMAYSRTRWVTKQAQQREIAGFRDYIHVNCLRGLVK